MHWPCAVVKRGPGRQPLLYVSDRRSHRLVASSPALAESSTIHAFSLTGGTPTSVDCLPRTYCPCCKRRNRQTALQNVALVASRVRHTYCMLA